MPFPIFWRGFLFIELKNGNEAMIKKIKIEQIGFTLVELLISIFILSLSIIGTLGVFARGHVYLAEIRQLSIATQAVREEVESIRDLSFAEVLALNPSFTVSAFDQLINPTGLLSIDDPYTSNDIRRVTATVSWISPQGRTLSRSLTTLITRNGINKQ